MAEPQETLASLGSPSYETALCVIPPHSLWAPIERLRSLHDKSYGKWPPHLNLIYPFVDPSKLSQAAECIREVDFTDILALPFQVTLDDAHVFIQKSQNIVHLRNAAETSPHHLEQVKNVIVKVLGEKFDRDSHLHLTVGQSEDAQGSPHKFFLEKARLLTPVSWQSSQLAVLVREPTAQGDDGLRRMKLWGTIDLSTRTIEQRKEPQLLYEPKIFEPNRDASSPGVAQTAYHFNKATQLWQPVEPQQLAATPGATAASEADKRLIVASYNVLAEFHWPPKSDRHPLLIGNILSARAVADILVLQEVTDHFLPDLLANEDIRARYPFCTHAPPGQPGIGPLPNLLNIAVLSRFPLQWEYVPFQRKHKGSPVVTFPTVTFAGNSSNPAGEDESQPCPPLVLGACHLSQGLVDGAVAAKKNELGKLLRHIASSYPQSPAIIAGDFNLSTSSHTIEQARRNGDLSSQGYSNLEAIDNMIQEARFVDAWLTTRLESGESSNAMGSLEVGTDLYEGEQGATFDPLTNALTAEMVAATPKKRPQRYDRILINDHLRFRPRGFNMFGENDAGHASDHWGVRCLFVPDESVGSKEHLPNPVLSHKASSSLGGLEVLKECLSRNGYLPGEEDKVARKRALELLESVIIGVSDPSKGEAARMKVVFVPVGSFALGVWTSRSDVDVTCIGDISSRTFFTLALQRLRKAAADGITILRRVRANSGTMLELDIKGIRFDLQYSTATTILHEWPEVMKRPSNDPAFSLPVQTLVKLKPARDLFYLRKSIPDLSQYRVMHLLIKAWAKSRGIYAAKFGLLGGIHISVLLVPICKALAASGHTPSTTDILVTFFKHYAEFDWKTKLVYDPYFHKTLRYHRTFREPLCLLGWHAPNLNSAVNASVPTVRTLDLELKRASHLLDQDGMTWDKFLNPNQERLPEEDAAVYTAADEFLRSFKSYVKIDAHYWGSSPSKGSKFLGWLESRCVSILVDIDRKVPDLVARIWPARFSEPKTDGEEVTDRTEFHGCYLVGLNLQDKGPSKDAVHAAEASLQSVLATFESRMRSDEKYYDENTTYLSATVVRGKEVAGLKIDEGYWNDDILAADFDLDDDDDDEDDSEFADEEEEIDHEIIEEQTSTRASRKKKTANSPTEKSVKLPGTGRFRTAADVINRLRWDPSMDISDWIIGYEDRFAGAMEKPLEGWKTEQTDEEFIPQHRILYFKKRSDGVIMWERRKRVDRIFGSGV